MEAVKYGVASFNHSGETECGDLSLVRFFEHGALIAVIDGLGHGHDAATAAQMAVATLKLNAGEPVDDLIKICHQALQGTRGAVMSLASINTLNNSVTQVGVGNVEVALFHEHSKPESQYREWLLVRGGVVGYELPNVRPTVSEIEPGDLLVFATDGIRSGFGEALRPNEPPQRIADLIMADFARGTDDALVLAASYLGEAA